MKTYDIIHYLIQFLISVVIAWLAFSLIIMFANPDLKQSDGQVNWLTTFWVAISILLAAWVIALLLEGALYLLSDFFSGINGAGNGKVVMDKQQLIDGLAMDNQPRAKSLNLPEAVKNNSVGKLFTSV